MDNKKQNKKILVLPQFHTGRLSINDLETITKLTKKYQVAQTKITSAQRIAFLGMEPDQIQQLQQELGISETAPRKRYKLHYIQTCPGETWCQYGVTETLKIAKNIENIELEGPLPAKVKVGISGCRMCCCESWVRDIGLIAQKKGWQVSFGGNAAGKPRIGDLIDQGLSAEEAVELVTRTLNYYIRYAKLKTRSARFMERTDLEQLRRAVCR